MPRKKAYGRTAVLAALLTFINPGLYSVELANGGCTNRDSIRVLFLPLPEFDLVEEVSSCEGETVELIAPLGLGNIQWEDGSTEDIRPVSTNGLYILSIEDDNQCTYTDSVRVDFAPLPQLELGEDTIICDIFSYTVIPEREDGLLTWFNGEVSNDLTLNKTNMVFAELNRDGCVSTDTVFIQFRECTFFQAYLPNIFSPNGDGINDDFTPLFSPNIEVLDFTMSIFDRWGNEVFSSNQVENTWDGNFNGSPMRSGVYIYLVKMSYRDDAGENSTVLQGDVTLVN